MGEGGRGRARSIGCLFATALVVLGYCGQSARAQDAAAEAESQGKTDNNAGACEQTTQAAAKACDFNAQHDFWIAVGSCDNLADAGKKAACNKQARSDRQSAKTDCQHWSSLGSSRTRVKTNTTFRASATC